MLKGNKGEWSEIYVFLKLLADGKLFAADDNLSALPSVYYPIVKILREGPKNRNYVLNRNVDVVDGISGSTLLSVEVSEFIQMSQQLLKYLQSSKGASFTFPNIESFLNSLEVTSLKAVSKDKSDIKLIVHDLNTGMTPTLGFSIKSMLGSESTLFNPGAGTNFIFKVEGPMPMSTYDIQIFNAKTLLASKQTPKTSKFANRLKELERLGYKLNFKSVQSDNLHLNLQLIDSQLPLLLSYIVYYRYKTGTSNLMELLKILENTNPLQFDLTRGHRFYEVKLKNFLTEIALGMTPETVWSGIYDATGGMIVVKKTGDVLCYHIYNRNEFQNYLLKKTYLDTPATSEDDHNPGFPKKIKAKPYKYGWLYEENGGIYIKLNLQIRFAAQ